MSPYREAATEHTCRWDVVSWPPPYHDIPVIKCTSCGRYKPRPWWERAIDFVLDAVWR